MCMRFNVIFTRFTHTLNLTCHPAGSNDVTRRGKKIKCPVRELQNAVEMHYNKAKNTLTLKILGYRKTATIPKTKEKTIFKYQAWRHDCFVLWKTHVHRHASVPKL